MSDVNTEMLNIEVAFALPQKQKILALDVPKGTTAEQAVAQSKMQDVFPDEKILGADLGVFGKSVKANYVLQAGDRIEVYRGLLADPKEVRKRRAAEAKAKRGK